MTSQLIIGIVVTLGTLGFLLAALWRLGTLALQNDTARDAFIKLMNPASLISILILLGVLFLLAMAILDLDKGRVLVGMGRAPFARGLITYLFAVVTIGTAVVLVVSALLGAEKEKFDLGKEVLGLLLGVFGTIVGFYFASEINANEAKGALSVSPVLVSAQEVTQGGNLTVTVIVRGGTGPYRFGVAFDDDVPAVYTELARPDGWIVKTLPIPASVEPGIRPITIGVQDEAGDKAAARTVVNVTAKPAG